MSKTQATPNPGSDFFSKITAGLSSGFERIATEVLPVWANNTLNRQKVDQLSQTTFQRGFAPPRADAPGALQKAGLFGTDVAEQRNLFNIGGSTAVLLTVVAITAVFMVTRK